MVYVKMVSEFANIKFCGKLGQNRPKMQFETTPLTQSQGQTQNGKLGTKGLNRCNTTAT